MSIMYIDGCGHLCFVAKGSQGEAHTVVVYRGGACRYNAAPSAFMGDNVTITTQQLTKALVMLYEEMTT